MGLGGGHFHPVAFESSSAFSSVMSSLFHSRFTFTSICSLAPSILPGLSASRTHTLARPPICTYTCAASQYAMHPGRDGRIHINLEVPNRFEVASKRMQLARLLRGAEVFHRRGKEKKKTTAAKKCSHIIFFLDDFFSPNLLSGADSDELQKKKIFYVQKYVKIKIFIGAGLSSSSLFHQRSARFILHKNTHIKKNRLTKKCDSNM